MSRGIRIAFKSLSIVLVLGILSSFVFKTVSDLNSPSPVNGNPAEITRESFKVGSEVISVRAMQKAATPSPKPAQVSLPRLSSMTELLGIFNQMGIVYQPENDDLGGWKKELATAESFRYFSGTVKSSMNEGEAMPTAAPALGGAVADADYSRTNAQVSGVDEGDIIKTDGKYIYAASSQSIRIIEANGADMRVVGEISLPQDDKSWENFSEMYIVGDYLVTVSTRSESIGDVLYPDAVTGTADVIARCIWYPQRQFTAYTVYDVSDRANPAISRKLEVEGYALATRMIGNSLYFVTNKYIYSVPADDMGEGDILPMYRDSVVSKEMCAVPVTDIAYIPGSLENSYMMAGAFDITGQDKAAMETVLGAGGTIYMSWDALYVAHQVYEEQDIVTDGWTTEIHRFTVDGAGLYYSGMGKAEGYPLNQYSMDEYNGYFRIATSDWNSGNRMTILDKDLKIAGKTEDLAQGEQIYSVRFMGDIGYMVTYRQVDPLFAVDLSDPTNPTVLGELKIPGFSQYLHPVGDGLMVGFGRHTTETYIKHEDGTEEVVGTRDMGMKISLFDVSDPREPREIDVMLLGENSWTAAFDNPRAMMVDPSKRLFGFATEGGKVQKNGTWTPEAGFTLVSVKGGKLVNEASLPLDTNYSSYSARLCYIGGTLYGVTENAIAAYDYSSLERLGGLSLSQ